LDLADEFGVSSSFEIGVDAAFLGRQSKLVQPRNLRLQTGLARQVSESGSAPQLQRLAELRGAVGRRKGLRLGAGQLAPVPGDGIVLRSQDVTPFAPRQHIRAN